MTRLARVSALAFGLVFSTTPAVGAGLASAVWTVEDLFRAVGEYQVTTLCE